MLGAFFQKLSNGMTWFLVIPLSVLILALSFVAAAFAYNLYNANEIHAKVNEFGVEVVTKSVQALNSQAAFLEDLKATTEESLGQLEHVSQIISFAEMYKFETSKGLVPSSDLLQKDVLKSSSRLKNAIAILKKQAEKIDGQTRALKTLKSEFGKIKNN